MSDEPVENPPAEGAAEEKPEGEQAPAEEPAPQPVAEATAKEEPALKPWHEMSAVERAQYQMQNGEASMCCCCVCNCYDQYTKHLTCCGFLPIKCGVVFIGVFVLVVAAVQLLEVFYQLLNDQIDWWYVLVGLLLSVPLLIAVGIWVAFFTKETVSSRSQLWWSLILVIISVALYATWNACYFWFLYKSDVVATGNDGVGFVRATRKQEIVFSLYVAAILCALSSYFICVCHLYNSALAPPEAKAEEPSKKADEEAPAKKED